MNGLDSKTVNKLLYGDSDNSNICYVLGNFQAVDPVLYLETPKGKFVFVSSLEINRAKTEAPQGIVAVVLDRSLKDILKNYLLARTKLLVDEDLPLRIAKLLESLGYRLVINDYFQQQRKIKQDSEIQKIKEVSKIVSIGFRELKQNLKQNIAKKRDISSELCRNFLENYFYQNGLFASHTIVAGGLLASQPHNIGRGVLSQELPIVFDIFPKSRTNGYYTDVSRTIFLRKPSTKYQKFYQDVLEAQQEAITMLRPHKSYQSIENKLRKKFQKLGYQTVWEGDNPQGFIHSLGHGVGLEVHEQPFCNNRLLLKPGMVLTIEPGLYYTDKALNHLGVVGGIRIEDTVAITDNGYEILTNLDYNPYL